MLMNSLYGTQRTRTFTEIFPSSQKFNEEYSASPFKSMLGMQAITESNISSIYYLLYTRYGNSHIAPSDETRFKYMMFSIISSQAPIFIKKKTVLANLLSKTEEEIMTSQRSVSNHAVNPGELGYVDGTTLDFINDQNTFSQKKGIVSGYYEYLTSLKDPTDEFLALFKKLFLTIVAPSEPLLYVTETEEN